MEKTQRNIYMLIIGDSIIKDLDGWRLKKRMKSLVSVRSISGASSKGMIHHVKRCLEDVEPDSIILNYGTNDLSEGRDAEDIADDIINLAISTKKHVEELFVSTLTMRNNKFKDEVIEVNEFLKDKCRLNNIPFIDNINIKDNKKQSVIYQKLQM